MTFKLTGKIKYSSTPVKDGFILRLGESSTTTYWASGVTLDSSKNIYVIGNAGGVEILVIKCNPSGSILWKRSIKTFSGGSLLQSEGSAIKISPVSPNNVHIVGTANTSTYYAELNKDTGEIVQSNLINNSVSYGNNDSKRSIGIGSTGQIYILGTSSINSKEIVINKNKNLEWQKTLGVSTTADVGNDIAIYSSNNDDTLYVVGSTRDATSLQFPTTRDNVLIAKYSSSGSLNWQVGYGLTTNNNRVGETIVVDADQNLYICGWGNALSYGGGGNHFIIAKFDSNGNVQWQKHLSIPTIGYNNHIGASICLDNYGYFYVAGSVATQVSREYLIAKYNLSGTIQWVRLLASSAYDTARAITADDSHIYIVGDSGAIAGDHQIHDAGGSLLQKYGKFTVVKLPSDGSGIGTYVGIGIGTYSTYTYKSTAYSEVTNNYVVGISSLTDSSSSFTTSVSSSVSSVPEYYYTNISIP